MTTSKSNPLPSSSDSSSSLPYFHSAYSPKKRLTMTFPAEGRTKQSFKDECDINRIMSRYQQTGVLNHLSQRTPVYGDFTGIDFQGAMDVVVQAQAMFAALPSSLRDRFANDPGRLVAFLDDPNNLQEAVRLGLVDDPRPQAAPLASPLPAAPAASTAAPAPASAGA